MQRFPRILVLSEALGSRDHCRSFCSGVSFRKKRHAFVLPWFLVLPDKDNHGLVMALVVLKASVVLQAKPVSGAYCLFGALRF